MDRENVGEDVEEDAADAVEGLNPVGDAAVEETAEVDETEVPLRPVKLAPKWDLDEIVVEGVEGAGEAAFGGFPNPLFPTSSSSLRSCCCCRSIASKAS